MNYTKFKEEFEREEELKEEQQTNELYQNQLNELGIEIC